ncbi:LOW QUALITY PROTEIN: hypothetical protein Cgig2_029906 [Carnegiea gigantea]|uniref:Uncharacterized protein n=1 Tax=Carnegiea gigantea TaxID=171969 RepID=A0A9Q1KGY8_9CARY|nr:LOW QUALITY PROTEIN: hypothetical protein Cgig2_029906 [Carnegiea gigantea]
MTPAEPLGQKPPDLAPATQPHIPITSPTSEQASKRPSIKNTEPTAASVPTIEQLNVQCPTSNGAPRPPIQPLRTRTASPCSATNNESHRPCQPPHALGTSQVHPSTRSAPTDSQSHSPTVKVLKGSTQQELHQEPASQESRESPSNGNNEDVERVLIEGRKISQLPPRPPDLLDHHGKITYSLMRKKKSRPSHLTTTTNPLEREVTLVRFLGYIAKLERFCPIGGISWHELNKTYKANIIEMSKFKYLADKGFDKCVLKHHGLKKGYFKPEEKTKEDMHDITLAEIGRDARASQTHYHTTGSTSYAETRVDFNEASAKVQERLLDSSPLKTQVEIENEVFNELMYEEENPKRSIGFGFNVDRSDGFGVNSVLRKRDYVFRDNNMELKRVKEELASQKAMFLLILKAVHNGKITDEFLDAIDVALCMVQEESTGNNLSNESRHTRLQPQPPKLIR